MKYRIELTKAALNDLHKLRAAGLEDKAKKIRDILIINPYVPYYEKLVGNLSGSRRINLQHRLVYEILEDIKTIRVLRMWTHYGDN